MGRQKAMTDDEIRAEIAKIEEQEAKIIAYAEENDPFWTFKPTDGKISEEQREFLGQYLKPEDIPEVVDGQLGILLDESDISGAAGGNQAGKSAVGCIDGYISHTGELPMSLKPYEKKFEWRLERAKKKYMNGRVIGVDGKQLRNTVIPSWKHWCPRDYLKKRSWEESFSSQYNVLYLYRNNKECGKIEFMTNEQDVESFQGPPLDWVKFDEEPKQAIFKENLMRFVTAEKLDVGFYWTPTHGLSWATDLFQDGIIDDKALEYSISLFKLCSASNPKANKKTLATILSLITDYNELKMRLLGEFISLSGLIYGKLWNRSVHVIDPFPIKYNDHIVYRGLDPHLAKASVCLEQAVDRNKFEYVCGTYSKVVDTDELKYDLAKRAEDRKYRLGWTACDKSADVDIEIFNRNIFQELKKGKHAIPALFPSEKFDGSIRAGVDQIKQLLKVDPILKKPKLFVFNIPENALLIKAMQTLERDTYANEDSKGEKDKIKEGKHDTHACLRYIHQRQVNWMPIQEKHPEPQPEESYV